MLIDTTTANPPAVCWFLDRTTVRAGRGPRRLEPTEWAAIDQGVPLLLKARGKYYVARCCYTTEQHAKDEAGRIARAEIMLERSRYTVKMTRLEQAQRLARA